MRIGTCALSGFFADETIQDIQRIEQEVRIHLMLELYIPILCHIGLFPFLLHLTFGTEGVVYHINDTVNGDLCQQGSRIQNRKVIVEYFIHPDRKAKACKYAFKQSYKKHKYNEYQYPDRFVPVSGKPLGVPYVQDIQADKCNQGERVREYLCCCAPDVSFNETVAGEQYDNAQSEYEDSAHSKYQPGKVWGVYEIGIMTLSDIEYAGQGDDAPSEDFRCEEGGHRVYGKCLCYECLEYPCTQISDEISEDVHDDDGGCCELDVDSAFETYYQRHCHREDGQKQLVFYSS